MGSRANDFDSIADLSQMSASASGSASISPPKMHPSAYAGMEDHTQTTPSQDQLSIDPTSEMHLIKKSIHSNKRSKGIFTTLLGTEKTPPTLPFTSSFSSSSKYQIHQRQAKDTKRQDVISDEIEITTEMQQQEEEEETDDGKDDNHKEQLHRGDATAAVGGTDTAQADEQDDASVLPSPSKLLAQHMAWSSERDLECELVDVPLDDLKDKSPLPTHTAATDGGSSNSNDKSSSAPYRDTNAAALEQQEFEEEMDAPQLVIQENSSQGQTSHMTAYAIPNPVINKKLLAEEKSELDQTQLSSQQQQQQQQQHSLLVVYAIGASELIKVQRFGVQSPFLEIRLASERENAGSSCILRTAAHKKGGSEAIWNKQLTRKVKSKQEELLVVVKTSTSVIGEARIPLEDITEEFVDHQVLLMNPDTKEFPAGMVKLQLKLMDATRVDPLNLNLVNATANGVALTGSSGANALTSPSSVALPIPSASDPPPVQVQYAPTKTIDFPVALKRGALMYKIPYHGVAAPKRQWIVVKQVHDHLVITWCDPQKQDKTVKGGQLELSLVKEIKEGHKTRAFYKQLAGSESVSSLLSELHCFSLITDVRTLDFAASSKDEAQVWISSLRQVIGEGSQVGNQSNAKDSLKKMAEFRVSALSARGMDSSLPSSRTGSSSSSGPLISARPSKDLMESWRQELFVYARKKMYDQVISCLDNGCPIDLMEAESGDTLLILACRTGDVNLMELCLSWRAKNDPHPEFGETALQVAVNCRNATCLKLLLSTAAKSDMDSEIVNHIDSHNDAPLHVAARHGDLECMELLLHHGADICVVEEHGQTPLHCAVINNHLECVAYMLDVGGDSVLNSGDQDGNTVLHHAAKAGNVEMVRTLLQSAATVDCANTHEDTPYDLAARGGHDKCRELIASYYSVANTPTAPSGSPPAPTNASASVLLRQEQEEEAREYQEQDLQMCGNEYQEDTFGAYQQQPYTSPSAQVREALAKSKHLRSYSMYNARSVLDAAEPYQYPQVGCIPTAGQQDTQQPLTEQIARVHAYQPCGSSAVAGYAYPARKSDGSVAYTGQYDYSATGQYASVYTTDSAQNHDPRSGSWNTALPQAPPIVSRSEWETYYTNDGYPYYVNTMTGMSQWENPFDQFQQHAAPPVVPQAMRAPSAKLDPSSSIPTSVPVAAANATPSLLPSHSKTDSIPANESTKNSATLSPDSLVRLKLAQTRMNRGSITARQAPASPGEEKKPFKKPELQQSMSTPNIKLGTPSRFEKLTGMKLSIEIPTKEAAAEKQVVARPVLVPSPRGQKSPKNASPRRRSGAKSHEPDADPSFEKSRPSSPRGRTASVQLIELKRANNLAMALSSFKIHDNYSRVVQAIRSMDESVMNAQLMGCLKRFFPSREEEQALRQYHGPTLALGKAERFFFELLQIPFIDLRIDSFLYKLEFKATNSSLLDKILLVRRACKNLVENFLFVSALEEFFENRPKSLELFQKDRQLFVTRFVPKLDERWVAHREDLHQAVGIDLMELQTLLHRFVTGVRSVHLFLEKAQAALVEVAAQGCVDPDNDDDSPRNMESARRIEEAHTIEVLERFLIETRSAIPKVEQEYDALGVLEDKLMGMFCESKATCSTTAILKAIMETM